MDAADRRLAWPAAHARGFALGAAVAAGLAGLAVLAGLAGFVLAWPLALAGGVGAAVAWQVSRHMTRRPMLAIEQGHLLCRFAGSQRGRAKLMTERRVPLHEITGIEREIHPWPGRSGARHYYRLRLRSGEAQGLVPRPADEATIAAMAAFFEAHFPGRVSETRLG